MKWLRLALSVITFPLSLLWYRRDIDHHRIPVLVYWLVMGLYIAANVWAVAYAVPRLMREVSAQLDMEL